VFLKPVMTEPERMTKHHNKLRICFKDFLKKSAKNCFAFYLNTLSYCNNSHRLNGSSSPVLTATSLSYGKAKTSTPHRIKTPDPIEIKFGAVDYVGEGTCHAEFYANPSKGGFPANG